MNLLDDPKFKLAFILFVFSFFDNDATYPKLIAYTLEESLDMEVDINPLTLFKNVLYKKFEKSQDENDCIKTKDVLDFIRAGIMTMNPKRLKTFMLDEGFSYSYTHNKKGSFFNFITLKSDLSDNDLEWV